MHEIRNKVCSKCRVLQSNSNFTYQLRGFLGTKSTCRDCISLNRKQYRAQMTPKERESLKAYMKQYNHKWYEENKEEFNRKRRKTIQ